MAPGSLQRLEIEVWVWYLEIRRQHLLRHPIEAEVEMSAPDRVTKTSVVHHPASCRGSEIASYKRRGETSKESS